MHFVTKIAAPLAVAGLVAAAPAPSTDNLVARNNDGKSGKSSGVDDATILNYALTLEHLERAFYRDSLNMYNAGAFNDAKYPSWVRERFTEIAQHERSHVEFLTSALQAAGATPVKECKYAFGVTSPETFLATSQILEGVGVSAYLGAAGYITNKDYLAAAASILVSEAQHETWVKSGADSQDPFPRAFPAGLDLNQVFSLAAPFITECPSDNPALPVKAFPGLTATLSGSEVTYKVEKDVGAKYAAFVAAVGTQFIPIDGSSGTVKVPAGITGQSYLILTKSKAVSDMATVAGPAIINIDVPASNFDYQ